MSIVTNHFALELAKLPTKSDELRIRFVPQVVNGRNALLVLYPDAEPDFEPSYARYAVLMRLRQMQSDGAVTVADGVGQIVITGQRLIGMITDGSLNKTVLSESHGLVYAFALDLDDCGPLEIKKNWRGKPVEALILSKDGVSPVLGIVVMSVRLLVQNSGNVMPAAMSAFLEHLTPEGQRNLQRRV